MINRALSFGYWELRRGRPGRLWVAETPHRGWEGRDRIWRFRISRPGCGWVGGWGVLTVFFRVRVFDRMYSDRFRKKRPPRQPMGISEGRSSSSHVFFRMSAAYGRQLAGREYVAPTDGSRASILIVSRPISYRGAYDSDVPCLLGRGA